MPDEDLDPRQLYLRNDQTLLRPLLIMGLIIVGGFLYFAYAGGDASNVAQAPATQTTK